jgi:hypothetical protein
MSWSVLTWNEPAIRFYRAVGAEPVEDSISFRCIGRAFDRLAGGPTRG